MNEDSKNSKANSPDGISGGENPGYASPDSQNSSRFTPNAEELFYSVVDNPNFFQQDAQLIYQALRDQFRIISFSDYLKRYIYQKAELTLPFEDVPLSEYERILVESFADGGIPASFESGSVRVRMAARNWLTQQTAYRDTVLLLGFGLHMQLRDVEELLTKGLQEAKLNRKDPKEALCAYCYAHGLGYHKYVDLTRACRERAALPKADTELPAEPSSALTDFPESVENEDALLALVTRLMRMESEIQPELESRRQFLNLYQQAQKMTAEIMNSMSREAAAFQSRETAARLNQTDQFFDFQKREWILNAKNAVQLRTPEDITPADIEKVMQSAIPRNQHGNLLSMKKSTLNRQFRNRRLTRQRLETLLSAKTPVTRYDLIMLCFYTDACKDTGNQSRIQIYRGFMERTNQILESCGMGSLYAANPFECFLMMCMLSGNPMGTYSDVIEHSYQEAI